MAARDLHRPAGRGGCLTLAEARDRGIDARAYDVATSAAPGASFHGRNTPGTARLVVDESRGLIIGATFTGYQVAECLHAATIAVVGEVPLERWWHAVPAFPTRSEVSLRLLEQLAALRPREALGLPQRWTTGQRAASSSWRPQAPPAERARTTSP